MSGLSVRPYGDRALLVELGDTERVVAWVDALREHDPPGLGDVVPAAETVLVVAAEGADLPRLRAALGEVVAGPVRQAPGAGDPVEIAVRYDGPDLSDV